MRTFLPVLFSFVVAVTSSAQDTSPAAVPAGKGAYAASIPPNQVKAAAFDDKEVNLLTPGDRPIQSNHWDSSLFYKNYGVGLWAYPLDVETSAQGFQVFYPTKWNGEGRDLVTDNPIHIGGKDFAPTGTKVKDWSDWMVSFRLGQGDDKYIDATLGEGMPYLWLECHQVDPVLHFDGPATFFDVNGLAATLPVNGETLGIEYGGRDYAVFAPSGTKFDTANGDVTVTFTGDSHFLVICPLPSQKDAGTFYKYAFAVPRETTISWQYDAAKGVISTDWKIKTETLSGTETKVIQGWIPHHYRTALQKPDFLTGLDYVTPRGTMHCSVGNEFVMTYPFTGISPNLPAPEMGGGENAYDPTRIQAGLAAIAGKITFGGDTYWGGKDLVRIGQAALIAKEAKDASLDPLVIALRDELTSWFTYTPGKADHYFAYYPKKKGLVGFNSSFGSEEFTDNHFHYGYFTVASALLAMQDPQWAKDYGPMATLVAKQYANWDRNDPKFPFLRTFDVWQGHSWAGGVGSDNGANNQESSSEATQSWTGLIYLGQALGDKDMIAAGVMGYNFESQAALEYWFNAHGDVFPPEYQHPIVGVIWSAGRMWGTWFSGDPAWIFGIQWVPSSPALSYFAHDPAWARTNWDKLMKEYTADQAKQSSPKPADIKSFDGDQLSYLLGYVLMYDPAWVCQKLDENAQAPGFAGNPWLVNIYYMAHSMVTLGHVDWTCHGDCATSMVYVNDQTHVRSFVVWNPTANPRPVKFYEGAKLLGAMNAAPQEVTSAARLSPAQP